MAIAEKDIKKLWGLAAGHCAFPECPYPELLYFLEERDPTVIGEMAHVIAERENGPRGIAGGGTNSYENLILLCPTHHRLIDKTPAGIFPEDIVHQWKITHESRVREALKPKTIQDKKGLFREIARILAENHQIWRQYGPESEEANSNPVSSAALIWSLRKLDRIVPNNRRIINLLQANQEFIDVSEFDLITKFSEHAEGFEMNCYVKREGVLRFPKDFKEFVMYNAQ